MDGTIKNGIEAQSRSGSAKAFRLLMVVFWTQYTVLSFVIEIAERLPFIGIFADYIMPVTVVVLVLLSLPLMIKKLRAVDIVFYLVCAVVVLGSMVLIYDNSAYIRADAWGILGTVVPLLFIGVAYSHEDSKKDLFWASLFGAIAVFAYQIYSLLLGRELGNDNMYTAYNVLPSVLYLIYWALENKKPKYWLISAAAVAMIFLFGTRGPVLATLVFLLLGIFFTIINQRSQLARVLYLIMFAVVIVVVGSKNFLLNTAEFLAEKFEDIGFSTRIFDRFIAGEIADGSGREVLYSKILDAIKVRPVLGYGLMGDRVILGFYVHNLFLELWCHYGVILGSVIILTMISVPVAALIKSRRSDMFGFVLMLSCMVFVKLMFTGSYLEEPYMFFLIGVSLGINRRFKSVEK